MSSALVENQKFLIKIFLGKCGLVGEKSYEKK